MFVEEIKKSQRKIPNRINADPENIEHGLAKLVLTVIELIRKVMEKEVIRRMERETLTENELERLGEALIKLEDKMAELKDVFGLAEEDLNIDLGPLGNLL
ncbi:MAG: gas vesicle protein K [Bacillota bacterium]